MSATKGYAALGPSQPLVPFLFDRRNVGPKDVRIAIDFCGICHSDIHQARDEWGRSVYPMVPGHEIVGRVSEVGSAVTQLRVGDRVGVGCFVDSCRECESCLQGEEPYCLGHRALTYNGFEKDGKTPTYGGYSNAIVVDENYVLRVPEKLDPAGCAPLLCAGITTYSPLRTWNVEKGQKVGVVGLGGLGHMAVKLASRMGAEVVVLSRNPKKKDRAYALGATQVVSTQEALPPSLKGQLHFILDTVSAPHDVSMLLPLLKRDGTLTLLGVPPQPFSLPAFALIEGRRRIAGSLIGGLRQTQEMLDFCGKHGITADVEVIAASDINDGYERVIRGDVYYRLVIDTSTI